MPEAAGLDAARPGTARRRLLVLDDDDLVGVLVEAIARTSGLETRMTVEPEAFLAAAAQWRPDLVFVDLTMPRMSGEQVLRRLAAQSCTARIIVSSGSAHERLAEAAALAAQCGLCMRGTLSKPFKPAALRALLGACG